MTCDADSCGRPARKRGMCDMHYQRWRKHGDPHVGVRQQRGTCGVEGCGKPHFGHGWCVAHWAKWRKYGDPLADHRKPKKTRCPYAGCRNTEVVHSVSGLCATHYRRLKLYGDADYVQRHRVVGSVDERLDAKLDKTGDCWLWTGCLDGRGYGKMGVEGREQRTHRLMHQRYKGPIPEGLQVLHRCHERRCNNPDHLYAGTRSDNMRDMLEAGRDAVSRGTARRLRGSAHPRAAAKLDEELVRAIRAECATGRSQTAVAADHGIAQATVSAVVRRISWAHVD